MLSRYKRDVRATGFSALYLYKGEADALALVVPTWAASTTSRVIWSLCEHRIEVFLSKE